MVDNREELGNGPLRIKMSPFVRFTCVPFVFVHMLSKLVGRRRRGPFSVAAKHILPIHIQTKPRKPNRNHNTMFTAFRTLCIIILITCGRNGVAQFKLY